LKRVFGGNRNSDDGTLATGKGVTPMRIL